MYQTNWQRLGESIDFVNILFPKGILSNAYIAALALAAVGEKLLRVILRLDFSSSSIHNNGYLKFAIF